MLKNKILKLRESGYTYPQIQKELNCAKSTISYHLNVGVKIKSRENLKQLRKSKKGIVMNKVYAFIQRKAERFILCRKKNIYLNNISFEEVIEKIGENPVCYITGDPIDLNNPKEYSFDHYLPVCLGGKSDISNLQIVKTDANTSKNKFTMEYYLELCEKALRKHKPHLFK